ncbi:PRKR-interacting protein 1 homolog [Diachasma alloeum]|uniref:PRKR-interacting protein 1 homolog n=1 Tax=Diachasma alloeum TaxID=454923 RepID=UPI00073831BD|nr:PRKR-interacting protein 1 homolog [Diachasma alloeum]
MSKPKKAEEEDKEMEKPVVAKTIVDVQRLKLMKLMKNPDRPVLLPERPKSKTTPSVPEFVRNVMGSSAGAGSGEFHVYRHLRRKEYARQKFIQEKSKKELLDEEYQKKIEENKKKAEELTAKRRAKRLQKKQKQKQQKRQKITKRGDESDKNEALSDQADESDEDNLSPPSRDQQLPSDEKDEEEQENNTNTTENIRNFPKSTEELPNRECSLHKPDETETKNNSSDAKTPD